MAAMRATCCLQAKVVSPDKCVAGNDTTNSLHMVVNLDCCQRCLFQARAGWHCPLAQYTHSCEGWENSTSPLPA